MAPQEDPNRDELKQFDIELRRLECEKLRAEIKDISLSWWQRPSYAGSVLTLAALLTGWVSGYFPSEREKLRGEIKSLTEEKDSRRQEQLLLNSDLSRLRDERNDFKQQKETLDAEKSALAGDIQAAKVEKQSLAMEIQQAEDRIDASYIRLKIALVDAQYAISHIAPSAGGRDLRELLQKDRERVSDLRKKLSGPEADLVDRLSQSHDLSMNIAEITAKDLKALEGALSSLGSKSRISMNLTSPMDVTGNGKTYAIEDVKKATDRQLLDWFRVPASGRYAVKQLPAIHEQLAKIALYIVRIYKLIR